MIQTNFRTQIESLVKAEKQQQQLIDQMKKANIEMPFNMEEFKLEIEAKMKEFEKNIQASRDCLARVEEDLQQSIDKNLLALKATISGTPQPVEETGKPAETLFNLRSASVVAPQDKFSAQAKF